MASFSLCLLATLALRPMAFAFDLLDRPGGRKTHQGEVPVIGGLAMLLGIVLGIGLVPLSGSLPATFLGACAILVTIGLLDDRFDLPPWTRLPAQAAAGILFVLGSGAAVENLGALLGGDAIELSGASSYVFTVLTAMAAVNAFNMIDGLDGLAGAIGLVSLLGMQLLAFGGTDPAPALLSLIAIGAVAAFLLSNLPVAFNGGMRCFMGDSGSTLLGFCVVAVGILLTQGPAPSAKPVTVLWLVALPLYDLIWAVVRRIIRGQSPLRPDTEHLHHLVIRAGFGARTTFAFFTALAALLAAVGILLDKLGTPEAVSFGLLVVAGGLVVRLMYRAEYLWRLLPRSARNFRLAP